MEIVIEKEFIPEEYLKENEILLNTEIKKNLKFIAILLFLAFSFLAFENLSNESTNYNDLAWALITVSIIISLLVFNRRKNAKLWILLQSKRLKGNIKYIINEKELSYTNSEREYKNNWSCYSHFRLLKNYILITNKWTFDSIILKNSDFDSKSRIELVKLLRNKLIEDK